MNKQPYRYRVCDVHELVLDDVELTVEVTEGDTVRVGNGRLMVVFAVVPAEDNPRYAGVLMVEPTSG